MTKRWLLVEFYYSLRERIESNSAKGVYFLSILLLIYQAIDIIAVILAYRGHHNPKWFRMYYSIVHLCIIITHQKGFYRLGSTYDNLGLVVCDDNKVNCIWLRSMAKIWNCECMLCYFKELILVHNHERERPRKFVKCNVVFAMA